MTGGTELADPDAARMIEPTVVRSELLPFFSSGENPLDPQSSPSTLHAEAHQVGRHPNAHDARAAREFDRILSSHANAVTKRNPRHGHRTRDAVFQGKGSTGKTLCSRYIQPPI